MTVYTGIANLPKVDTSTPDAFVNATVNSGFAETADLGLQCVAGWKWFSYSAYGRYFATNSGGANGYASQQAQFIALGMTVITDMTQLQNGDWIIHNGGTYGHISMFRRWASLASRVAVCYGENQGNGGLFCEANLDLDTGSRPFMVAYRPNKYIGGNAGYLGQNTKEDDVVDDELATLGWVYMMDMSSDDKGFPLFRDYWKGKKITDMLKWLADTPRHKDIITKARDYADPAAAQKTLDAIKALVNK